MVQIQIPIKNEVLLVEIFFMNDSLKKCSMYIHKQIKLVFFSLSNRKTGGWAATTFFKKSFQGRGHELIW